MGNPCREFPVLDALRAAERKHSGRGLPDVIALSRAPHKVSRLKAHRNTTREALYLRAAEEELRPRPMPPRVCFSSTGTRARRSAEL